MAESVPASITCEQATALLLNYVTGELDPATTLVTAPPPRDASKRRSGSPASASTSATLGWGMSQRSSMVIHHINRAAVSPRPGALQNSYALRRRLVSSERPRPSDPPCPLPSIHCCIFWLCRSI